jgi:hypothetical protein
MLLSPDSRVGKKEKNEKEEDEKKWIVKVYNSKIGGKRF